MMTLSTYLLQVALATFLPVLVVGGAWWVLSHSHGWLATVALILVWLVVLAVWLFFAPVLNVA